MANATFDEKIEDLVSKHVGGPRLSIGPNKPYYALVPGRDPNDSLDQAMRGAGQAIMSDFRGNTRPLVNTGFDMSGSAEGAISTGNAAFGPQAYQAFHRLSTMGRPEVRPGQPLFFGEETAPTAAINPGRFPSAPGSPTLQDVSRKALGFPQFGSMEEGINRIAALPDRTPMGVINPNAQAALPAPSESTRDVTPGRNVDMVLAANRGPASGYSYNPRPEDMGNYEYGGKFNGKDVWFWKQNDMQNIFNNAKAAILEYQRRNPNDPMIGAVENLLNAMNINPNAESTRALQGAHADLYRAQSGAIPSEIEERRARANYYGRPQPFTLAPGQEAFLPQGQDQAMKIAEGPSEKPAAANVGDKMNEVDKEAYKAASHLASTSLDPEVQKMAFARMDAIERKYAGPKMDRNAAYAKLRASGKYTDDQINAKLADLGL